MTFSDIVVLVYSLRDVPVGLGVKWSQKVLWDYKSRG